MYIRAINRVREQNTKKIIEAKEVFKTSKSTFSFRKKLGTGEFKLSCLECGQALHIAVSENVRPHFKHFPDSYDCILKKDTLSEDKIKSIDRHLESKESPRHIELKNKIGGSLFKNKAFKNVSVDDKFIMSNGEKRKPDVYCEYQGKRIVFEIQLSHLPLEYLLKRCDFYQKNQIYLIWILDNLNPKRQSQFQKDIKYINKYETFFQFDEEFEDFKLICHYKSWFLNQDNDLRQKWQKKSVTFDQLKYSQDDFQVYYYDNEQEKKKLLAQQEQREKEIQEERERRTKELQEQRQRKKEQRVSNLLERIKDIKEGRRSYLSFREEIFDDVWSLDDDEKKMFTQKFKVKNPFIRWIEELSNSYDRDFLELMIILCRQLGFNINCSESGKTTLVALLENKNIYPNSLIVKMLQVGYIITDSDFKKIKETDEKDKIPICFFKYANDLNRRCLEWWIKEDEDGFETFYTHTSSIELIEFLFKNYSDLIKVIESAKRKKIIGYKFNSWIAFANNTFYYKEYWKYIELAFKYYGLWDTILKLDKKGSFKRKYQELQKNYPKQDSACEDLLSVLYPELGLKGPEPIEIPFPGSKEYEKRLLEMLK